MKESKLLYDYPDYYDIAFSFRDIRREAEVFDECIRLYSTIPVRRVLELGSGTAPHIEEWARRGIDYVGIDTNENMLAYASRKAQKLQIAATLIKADMRSFSLGTTVDFAYILLGSLFAKTPEDIDSHFTSVAEAPNHGGLYFLDWCINFHWADPSGLAQSWRIDRSPVKINMSFKTELLDRAGQTVRNLLTAKINDNGKLLELEETDVVKTIFPHEFLLLVEKSKKLEFVGWWNNSKLEEPIQGATRITRPIALVRRRNL